MEKYLKFLEKIHEINFIVFFLTFATCIYGFMGYIRLIYQNCLASIYVKFKNFSLSDVPSQQSRFLGDVSGLAEYSDLGVIV